MANEIPDPIQEQGFEDTQSIEDNIDTLYSKFIAPIDRLRSMAEPPKDQNQSNQVSPELIKDLNVDAVRKLESRAHAFYRILGLPVVGGTQYYNPGYDPNPKSQQVRASIASKVSDTNKQLMEAREYHHKTFSQMFVSQGYDTTAYGIALSSPKPFNIIDDSEVALDFRDIFINAFKSSLDPNMMENIGNGQSSFISRFGYPVTSVQHVLKPFMVDPAIDYTVMPVNNKIAVPFLKDKQATKVSANPDVFLDRPGLEFIIRTRLKDTEANIGSLDLSIVDTFEMEEVFNFTLTQNTVVSQLIKAIKVSITLLYKAVEDLARLRDVQEGITFLPVSSVAGYEFGGSNREYTRTVEEKNIALLQIKKMYADQEAQIDTGIGNFATAQFVNLEKLNTILKELEKKQESKNEQVNNAIKCLKTIEIITGEASGFGLVDILAVYTALWTIKIEDLLVLLDQESIDRLYNFNVSLRSDVVVNRKNSPGSIENVLTTLEEKITSILEFADKLYGESFASVQVTEGGSPV